MSDTPYLCDVVLLAAGSSRRMNGIVKQFEDIGGKQAFRHALDAFTSHSQIGTIIIVVPDGQQETYKSAVPHETVNGKTIRYVTGGAERHLSVRCGLDALRDSLSAYIAIHDAARPFVPHEVIDRCLASLSQGHRAVIPALAVADTIKLVAPDTDASAEVINTLPRDQLRRIQTPQIFDKDLIHRLYDQDETSTHIPTDDASLAEAAGVPVMVVDGDECLAKITWQSDLATMKASFMPDNLPQFEYRTGTGFDVHRFDESTGDHQIMVCGLSIAHERALLAHSDGDVGIHALCDAIFGALCDGDIGMHFPPTDERWRGAASDQFLTYALARANKVGATLMHIDVTILCERPKIGPHRDEMRQILADICKIDISRVSVKATTTEKLGFTGRGDGIAAQAAATLALPLTTRPS